MNNAKTTKQELAKRDGLRCAVTGEEVTSLDELEIDRLVPLSKGGTDELDNLILVRPNVNRLVSDDERRRTRLLIQQLRQRQEELATFERESFEREQAYRKQQDEQRKELEEFRHSLQRQQSERELVYSKELEQQRRHLQEQEAKLVAHMRSSETEFARRLADLEAQKAKLSVEIQEREALLQLSFEELEKEKLRYTEETRRQVETNAATYVNDALSSLENAAAKYRKSARNWSLAGVASLLLGAFVAAYFGLSGLNEGSGGKSLEWAHVVFFTFKGLILIGLLVALAKYCFVYSQSFMHESLKNSERKHAIKFGKFYLESYGANAEWAQIREAFEHWNIAPASAFSTNDADKFDPRVIDHVAQLVESLSKLNPSKPAAASEQRRGF